MERSRVSAEKSLILEITRGRLAHSANVPPGDRNVDLALQLVARALDLPDNEIIGLKITDDRRLLLMVACGAELYAADDQEADRLLAAIGAAERLTELPIGAQWLIDPLKGADEFRVTADDSAAVAVISCSSIFVRHTDCGDLFVTEVAR